MKHDPFMTELELRQAFALSALRWVGTKERSAGHKKLLQIYNSYQPLPRDYTMQEDDPWCAAGASAMFIDAGLSDLICVECSCGKMITGAQKRGIWQELDSYRPGIGDLVMYDFDAPKDGDCTGNADHVGIVFHGEDNTLYVVECNYTDAVAIRTITIDHRYIRGFITPDFASKVCALVEPVYPIPVTPIEEVEKMNVYHTLEEVPEYARSTVQKLVTAGSLLGLSESDLGLTEEMLRVFTVLDRHGCLSQYARE